MEKMSKELRLFFFHLARFVCIIAEAGLPPGRHEVDIVERLRRKRAWEAQLPPLDCQENIKTRYNLIAEMEKSDWQFREKVQPKDLIGVINYVRELVLTLGLNMYIAMEFHN